MPSLISSCMNVIRNLPQGSSIDIPWGWMKSQQLAEESVIFPNFDLKNEQKIQQTAARLFFAWILPSLARPFGLVNVSLGITHFVWCICNIQQIRRKENGYSSKDFENALIRILTGVYDLAIGYLLCSSLMTSIYGKSTIPLMFALLPSYSIQLHYLIFEKATRQVVDEKDKQKITTEIDHRALKVGCFIKQFCNGLILSFFPEPQAQGLVARLTSLPSALLSIGAIKWGQFRGTQDQLPAN